MEAEVAFDLNAPTTESYIATAVSSLTPTPITIYSIAVSSAAVPSIPTRTRTTITNCNHISTNLAILLNALSHDPHRSSTAHSGALVQWKKGAAAPISSTMLSPTPPFNVQFDRHVMDSLEKKPEEC